MSDLKARIQRIEAECREAALAAKLLADKYDAQGDQSGNAHAFLKERRVWTECADKLKAALLVGEEPPADKGLDRRTVTATDLQDVLKANGYRGDSFSVDYVTRAGLQMKFYPRELIELMQTFLDAEHTRMLLRGTFEGWKSRTQDKLAASPLVGTPTDESELQRLVRELQAHAKEHGWQDVDEPIAALLAWDFRGCQQCRQPLPHDPYSMTTGGDPDQTYFFCSPHCRERWNVGDRPAVPAEGAED